MVLFKPRENKVFHLPTADHPARELIDVAHVAEVLAPQNAINLLTTFQARKSAERAFEADTAKVVKRVCYIVLRADNDERWLISFGRRGGWRKEWNFGTGRV
jgi:hypothetical protein